jgi:hypothetical protein
MNKNMKIICVKLRTFCVKLCVFCLKLRDTSGFLCKTSRPLCGILCNSIFCYMNKHKEVRNRHKGIMNGKLCIMRYKYQKILFRVFDFCFSRTSEISCIVIGNTSDNVQTLRWADNGHFGRCPNPSLGSERTLRTMSKPFVGQQTDTSDKVRTLCWAANGQFGQNTGIFYRTKRRNHIKSYNLNSKN